MIRKRLISLLVILILLGAASFSIAYANNTAPTIKVNDNKEVVKVFVGRPSNHISLDKYAKDRKSELTNLAKEDDSKVIDALIVLNNFVDTNEAKKIAQSPNVEIKRIWISTNGSQAGGDAIVIGNDVNSALANWIEEFQRSYDSLKNGVGYDILYEASKNNEVQIYALLVSAPSAILNNLNNDSILMVDAHYSKKAINMANNNNYEVRYIDCPRRPDGIN